MFPARRRSSVSYDGMSELRGSADPSRAAGGTEPEADSGRGPRSSTQYTRASNGSASTGGADSSGSGYGRANNQAEDAPTMSTRRGSASTVSTRAASSPSGSPYLEQGFQRHGQGVRKGRCNGREEPDIVGCETPRRSSGGGGRSARDGHEGGRVGRVRAPPATAPSAIELGRLPSIDGLDVNAEEPEGYSEETPSSTFADRPRRERDLGSSATKADHRSSGPASGKTTSGYDQKDRGELYSKQSAAAGGISGGGRSEGRPSGGRETLIGGRVSGGGGAAASACRGVGAERQAKADLKSNGGDRVGSVVVEAGRGECLVGLQNLGNTCFMNACLQCLLHTEALVDVFRRRVHQQRVCRKSPTQGALAEAFGELVRLMETAPAHSNVSPAQVSENSCPARRRF